MLSLSFQLTAWHGLFLLVFLHVLPSKLLEGALCISCPKRRCSGKRVPPSRQLGWLTVPLGLCPAEILPTGLSAAFAEYVAWMRIVMSALLAYLVFSSVALAKAVAPQNFLDDSLSTVVLRCYAVYGGCLRLRNVHARSLCFQFWLCLAPLV
jgi:hypothetical protein